MTRGAPDAPSRALRPAPGRPRRGAVASPPGVRLPLRAAVPRSSSARSSRRWRRCSRTSGRSRSSSSRRSASSILAGLLRGAIGAGTRPRPDGRRDPPGRGRRLRGPGRPDAVRSASRSRSSPAASTRWPPGSRPTRSSAATCSPTSATSCARRSRSSPATSRRSSTGSTRPTRPTSRRSSTRPASSSGSIDDLRTITLSEAGTLPLHPEPTDPDLLVADVVALLPTGGRGGRRGDRHRRSRRPADPRDRPGPHPRGALEPGRQRAPPHAGGRSRDDRRRPSTGVVARPERRRHRARDRSGAASRTSSTGS